MDENVTLKDNQRYTGQILGTDKNNQTRFIRTTDEGFTIVDDIDNAGRNSFNGIFGEQLVASRNTFISSNFYYGFDTKAFYDLSTNLGYVDFDENMLRLNTGASANSIGMLASKEVIRYRAGRDAEAMFTTVFANPKDGLNQIAGAITENDGFFIGFIDEEFGVGIKKGGEIVEWVSQDNFNGDRLDGTTWSEIVLNKGFINIFRINYGYLGIAPTIYEFYGGLKYGWINFHTIDLTNKQVDTNILNPYLTLRAYIENTTNTTDESIKFGSIAGSSFNGHDSNQPDSTSREFSASVGETTVLADTETIIVTVHNKENFKGRINYIKSLLLNLSASVIGTKPVTLKIKKISEAPSLVTGTYSDIDTTNSTLEYSLDAEPTQVQLDNSETLLSREMSKEGIIDKDVSSLNLSLYPSEYVVFTLHSTNSTVGKLSIRESERF